LWTNYPVATFEDATLVIENYAKRWRIEDFHKTWKSGACKDVMGGSRPGSSAPADQRRFALAVSLSTRSLN